MDTIEAAVSLLPERLRQGMKSDVLYCAEELRLRLGRRPTVLYNDREHFFSELSVCNEDIFCVMERATNASLHAVSAQMLDGYINYRGVRVGVCGAAVMRGGELTGLKNYSSLAIRIPREIKGICDGVLLQICSGGFESTLIISPPGGGKTTALREVIRLLSEQNYRVGVVDERNELSAVDNNEIGFNLGSHSDVLSGVSKERGTMMLLRGMNPQIIAMDEITKPADIETIMEVNGCGVRLLASAHAKDYSDLMQRPIYRTLLEQKIFRYLVIIAGSGSERKYTVRRLEK